MTLRRPLVITGNSLSELQSGDSVLGDIVKLTPEQIGSVLAASDAADNDNYGYSTALTSDGAILAVGAPSWEGSTGTDKGGVYIYDWNGFAWVQRGAVIEAADAADNDRFGFGVSISASGTILAVGANGWEDDSGVLQTGGVYIYDWNGSAWVQRGNVIKAADAESNDAVSAVSLNAAGTILAFGAGTWEGTTGTNRGGVYIYDWSGSAWVQRGAVLEASDAADDDNFGRSVSLSSSGTVLAVGASNWEGATGSNRGGVYIYDWSGSAWVQRGSVLEASDAENIDRFGQAVSLSADGTVLAVGAPYWEGSTGTDKGGVYIYDWSGAAWIRRGTVLEASDAADSDQFGFGVALSGNGSILTVGANLWEGTAGSNRGGVYTYTLTSNRPGVAQVATGTGFLPSDLNPDLLGYRAGQSALQVGASRAFFGAQAGYAGATAHTYATAIGAEAKVDSASTVVLGRTTDTTVIGATAKDSSNALLQVVGSSKLTGQYINASTKTLTESSATGIVDIAVAAGTVATGEMTYAIEANDGTDYQTLRGRARYAVVNKAGTLTVNLIAIQESLAVSAGTLTATCTSTSGTNKITLNLNAVSSLTQTTLRALWRIEHEGGVITAL